LPRVRIINIIVHIHNLFHRKVYKDNTTHGVLGSYDSNAFFLIPVEDLPEGLLEEVSLLSEACPM
jgi:hypothetical protein